MAVLRSALHDEQHALGATFTDFGGWQMPLKYGSELAEHHAVRRSAGIFDLSHMGELWVSGPDAAAFLDFALVGKLSAIAVGKAKYSLICTPDGGVIDDLIAYRRSDAYLVVPNAANVAAVLAALRERAAGFDVRIEDATAELSLIAVQGPRAAGILARLVPAEQQDRLAELRYYAADQITFALPDRSLDLLVARTGYTGEDGFELFVGNQDAVALWRAVVGAAADGELTPAGLASRDSLRLEAGMPLYGNELSLDGDPFAAGLGPVVALSKEGDFVGKAALAARKQEGATRKLVGLKGLGRRAARSHYPVLKDGVVVGEVTSGAPSPTLGYPVALAYVDVEHAEPGTALDVDLRGKPEPFEVTSTPFYRRER